MQLEVVDSHNAPPLTCFLLLRLFRFGFDFVFGLKFVCRRVSLDCLVSAAALILFDQESPSPLTSLNNCVLLNRLRFSIFLATSANHHFMLRFASSAAKNLKSLPHLRYDLPCSVFVLDLQRVAIQTHYINTQNCSVFVLNFGVF